MAATTTPLQGLTDAEADVRRKRGQGNNVRLDTSRTYGQIIRQNVFTFINMVLFTIGALLLILGRFTDAFTSVGLILLNIVIGIYQEARAKRKLDQIALLTRPKARIIRGGQERECDPAEIVVEDLVVLRAGDQIVVDGVIVGDGKIDVDESLLTGESDLIPKTTGDEVLSGSFVVNGQAVMETRRVGADSYAHKMTASARAYRVTRTPLQRDIDFFIRLLMLLALFLGFLLLVSAFVYSLSVTRSVQMAAVIAGLVPNGLFFMVIVAYAMGALRIAGRGALIQQTNSVESLSHVNVLCMDKTGTLTANRINYHDIFALDGDSEKLKRLLGDFAANVTAGNKTSDALAQALPGSKRRVVEEAAFSSARKWSALVFDDPERRGTVVLGALEMLQPAMPATEALNRQLEAWSDQGLRVVTIAFSPQVAPLTDSKGQAHLPPGLQPLGLVSFSDELRPHLRQTLDGFREAGIQLKVISGDNPHTVAALAKQAGFAGDLKVISGTELDALDDQQIEEVAETTTIFGRITPQQKERLVDALRRRGHYVAMMGDGVNDVLSLKKANLGIAMNSGSAATRGVADIVLIEDSFAALPPAFLEGQRIINGMVDILRLFLTRALSVALNILSTAVVGVGFPYVPTHTALLTLLTVGIPTFFLAAWARPGQMTKRIIPEIVRFVLPAALSLTVFGLLIYLGYYAAVTLNWIDHEITPETIANFQRYVGVLHDGVSVGDFTLEAAGAVARTMLTMFSVFSGLLLVLFVEPPTTFFVAGDDYSGDRRPALLAGLMLIIFIFITVFDPVRNFFELTRPQPRDYLLIGCVALLWMVVIRFTWRYRLFERFLNLSPQA